MNHESREPVVLYDPAVSSLNLGDHIISDSCRRELEPIVGTAFLVAVSTHLPISGYMDHISEARMRFVCGSNLLRGRMNARFRQWDITPWTARFVGPATLMGVGWWQYGDKLNSYTRWLYGRVLERDAIHSVRDDYTARQLRSMGFDNVLNTACPTMWQLDETHCASIPTEKADVVLTTVTDYSRDPTRDRLMLAQLAEHYTAVRIFLQGTRDLRYLESLELDWSRFDLIPPRLEQFDACLSEGDVDYVGTRLHAGIRALQHGRRSLVIGVDNRAAEKHRDFNLPCLPREDIADLSSTLRRPLGMHIRIPQGNIDTWKTQFIDLPRRQGAFAE